MVSGAVFVLGRAPRSRGSSGCRATSRRASRARAGRACSRWFCCRCWLALVIFYAPIEEAQGIIQKIFYVHTPAIIPTYAGFLLTAIGGIGYLRTRSERWDHLAVAGAEVGVVFCTLMLIVGPLWAKPAWGHWWVWDLRLTTTLMLWFIYVAYVFLRSFAFGSDTSRTFTAIYGIAGIAAIPFVYFAVDLAQGSTMHPSNPTREGLPPAMGQTAGVGLITFVWIFAWLVAHRMEIAALEERALQAHHARSERLMGWVLAAYGVTAAVLGGYALQLWASREGRSFARISAAVDKRLRGGDKSPWAVAPATSTSTLADAEAQAPLHPVLACCSALVFLSAEVGRSRAAERGERASTSRSRRSSWSRGCKGSGECSASAGRSVKAFRTPRRERTAADSAPRLGTKVGSTRHRASIGAREIDRDAAS